MPRRWNARIAWRWDAQAQPVSDGIRLPGENPLNQGRVAQTEEMMHTGFPDVFGTSSAS